MASRALLWVSGETPAQQDASTLTLASGKNAFNIIAFEIEVVITVALLQKKVIKSFGKFVWLSKTIG